MENLKFLPSLIAILLCSISLTGQYNVNISLMSGEKMKGSILTLEDEGLSFLEKRKPESSSQFIPLEDIKAIKARRKGTIVFGGLIGAVLGGTAGYMVPVSCRGGEWFGGLSCDLDKISNSLIGATIGMGVGLIVSTFRLEVPIQGKKDNYQKHKLKIKKLKRAY